MPAAWEIKIVTFFTDDANTPISRTIIYNSSRILCSSKQFRTIAWTGVVSRGWAEQVIVLPCAVVCQIVSLQYLSRSSLHRLAGLPCRLFLSYGLQVVTREVRHRSSLRRLVCPVQDLFLTLLIISMAILSSP